jgi:hypothetical protein
MKADGAEHETAPQLAVGRLGYGHASILCAIDLIHLRPFSRPSMMKRVLVESPVGDVQMARALDSFPFTEQCLAKGGHK